MTSKLFEVRDRATCLVVLATRLDTDVARERRLLRHAGYGDHPETYVVVTPVNGGASRASDDPYGWGSRTLTMAHQMILDGWEDWPSGAVIDVRVGYGEATTPVETQYAMEGGDGGADPV